MGLESYISILESSLNKKATILQALLEATREQEVLADEEKFDYDAFSVLVDRKDALLEQINEIDDGFDQTFRQVRVEINDKKDQYKDEIARLQKAIRVCTDIGVEIQALEQRNHDRLESIFSVQKKEVRKVKANSKVVSNYYKVGSTTGPSDAIFMDHKS